MNPFRGSWTDRSHKLLQTVCHHQSYRVTVCSFQSSYVWNGCSEDGDQVCEQLPYSKQLLCIKTTMTQSQSAMSLQLYWGKMAMMHYWNSRNHRSAAAYIIRDLQTPSIQSPAKHLKQEVRNPSTDCDVVAATCVSFCKQTAHQCARLIQPDCNVLAFCLRLHRCGSSSRWPQRRVLVVVSFTCSSLASRQSLLVPSQLLLRDVVSAVVIFMF